MEEKIENSCDSWKEVKDLIGEFKGMMESERTGKILIRDEYKNFSYLMKRTLVWGGSIKMKVCTFFSDCKKGSLLKWQECIVKGPMALGVIKAFLKNFYFIRVFIAIIAD